MMLRLFLTILIWLVTPDAAGAQSPRASLVVTPTDGVAFQGEQGGPFTPPQVSYQVTATQSWVNVRVQGPPWLTVHLSSTRTPATATFSVNPANLGPGTYDGTITFTNASNGQGNTTRPAHVTVTAPLARPDMSFTETVQPSTYSAAGEAVTFTYQVQNVGTTAATRIVVTSSLGAQVTCVSGQLAPGEQMACRANYTIPTTGSNVTDTGSLVADNIGQAMTANATVTFVPPSQPPPQGLTLVETVNPATYTNKGDSVTFTYTVHNTGTVNATGVMVHGTLGDLSGVSCPQTQVAVGATMSCAAPYMINATGQDLTDVGTLTADSVAAITASATVRYQAPPPVTSSCRSDVCVSYPQYCSADAPTSLCR